MDTTLESDWWAAGLRVAGVDEAGRGALAGPLVAAAVILPPGVYVSMHNRVLRFAGVEKDPALGTFVRAKAAARA